MTFIWPAMLLLGLVLIPSFVMVYIAMQQRRRHLIWQYANLGLTQGTQRRVSVRRHIPAAVFLVALAILIVALARPQTTLSLPRLEGTIILAFDVSGSMAGDDLKPTRLEAAKAAA